MSICAEPRARVVCGALCAWLASCAAFAPTDDPRPVTRGPLPTRVMLPQALAFPEPRPRRVAPQPAGSLGAAAVLSYTSIYEYARVGPDAVELDAEVAHLGLLARYGVTGETDVEVEVATSFATSGFLDSIVDEYHALFGFPDGDRDRRPRDEYALRLGLDGVTAWEREEDELELMDVPIHVTHTLRRPVGGQVGVALRAGLELPTGDEDVGTGSGGVDCDLGVLLEQERGRWVLSGGADLVLVDTPESYRAAGVDVEDLWLLTCGAEYRWNDRTSVVSGLRYRSLFTDDFTIKEADKPILDLALGVVRDAGPGRWFAAFHEDLFADSGPDIVLTFGYAAGL